MQFRIADTFTDSLARLTGENQKAIKTTAFDLQLSPSSPGLQFHRLDQVKDKNFWSVRVNRDIRIIVHRNEKSLLLCYVDHHDKAYEWASRRKLQIHPKTGAAQLVEIRETIQEISIPVYREKLQEIIPLSEITIDELLKYGVPDEWINDIKSANEDTLLDIAAHLPAEASEAILNLAIGVIPQKPSFYDKDDDPFNHPDAQRRFRIMQTSTELEQALEYPWEKWAVFLHPFQRQLVENNYNGSVRISGSAGTGKTIVALHRAVYLARHNQNARVLLTTFSDSLANALMLKLRYLISNQPHLAERLEVHSISAIGLRLFQRLAGRPPEIAPLSVVQQLFEDEKLANNDIKQSLRFLLNEWKNIVDAWQIKTWEEYRDVLRLGRKTRLPESQRQILWKVFNNVRGKLKQKKMITFSDMFTELANRISNTKNPLFDYTIVDEAQDISIAQLRFISALGKLHPDGLFFAGDLGQRIFRQTFSWKAAGVDIQGRSRTLTINYRTSHQIRSTADKLLDPEISDGDGNIEQRGSTISVFNGIKPTIIECSNTEEEVARVGRWIQKRLEEGLKPHEIGVFIRSDEQIPRAQKVVNNVGIDYIILNKHIDITANKVTICTMHLTKGLEFRAVAVMACDDEVIPLQARIETVSDDSDLEEVYNTERHLLYVACTRARDFLFVTGVAPSSEFLEDLKY